MISDDQTNQPTNTRNLQPRQLSLPWLKRRNHILPPDEIKNVISVGRVYKSVCVCNQPTSNWLAAKELINEEKPQKII